ncbi:MAG: NapC/NirT family cytochrome c [Actinobacteria bacterium]|nr:NapC/NirT family cytochrome c [Actinomycetota bacterium]MCL5883187.1 NapC/NirT family cytochrome c [Actinomycetota bacterium]
MRGRSILATVLVVLFIGIIGVTVWGIRYTNSPDFCNSCHIIQPFVAAWKTSPMGNPDGPLGDKNVKCVDCHFEPGVLGYARGKIYSLMKLTEYGTHSYDTPPPSADLLTNSSCLQCHGKLSDRKPGYETATSVTDPTDPTYPKIAVTDQYSPDKTTIYFPHDFHVNTAQLNCADCHSGVVHGAALMPDRAQAAADPSFCKTCHTGDTAPIIFGPITLSGREHPGVPKIDTAIWRNNHWKLAKGPGTIEGVNYDKIDKKTCLACHKDPNIAPNCKSCHFASEPDFTPTAQAQRDSAAPLSMFGLVIGVFMLTLVPWPKAKRFIFEGWIAALLGVAVFVTDVYAFWQVITNVLDTSSGSRDVGPMPLWIAYIMASSSLLIFLFHQGVLKPRRRRLSKHD